ncbi:MAG TPA: hypothetical protein VF316_12905, partial [Polyangiaceae bacterium]
RRLPRGGMGTGILAVYEHDGRPRFQKLFSGAWNNAVEQVLVRDDGRIVVVGSHGQGFSLDGKALPHRDVPKAGSDDADFHAQTPFLAVFDAKGKLELLDDLDALVHHSPSTSYRRTCSGTLAQGAQANEAWVLAQCGMSEATLPEGDPERGSFRFLVRGTDVGPATRVGPIEHATNADAWKVAPNGSLFAVWADRDRAYLAGVADGHALVGPLVEAQASAHGITSARQLVPTKSGVWAAVMLEEGVIAKDAVDRIVVASAGSDLATPVARVLATMSRGGSLDALAVDDEGRPIVSLGYGTPMVLAGQSFVPSVLAPETEPSGRVFVRLTKDGARIDRVFVPQPKPGGCSLVGLGSVTSMAVRANVLALTYRFGVKDNCGIHDEPSTVMAFTLPP